MSSLFPDILRATRVIAALWALNLLAPPSSQAGDFFLAPGLFLRQEYNDNVEAVSSNRRGDEITTVSPTLAVSHKSETGAALLSGGASALYYRQHTRSDSVGYFLNGAGSWAPTPRLGFSADLGYTRDSSASSIDPASALVVSSRTQRQSCRLAGRYQLDELSASSFAFDFGKTAYDTPTYPDASYFQGSAGVDYDLGRFFPKGVVTPLVSLRQDRTPLSQVDNLNLTLGFSRALDELWALSLNGGARFTRSEFGSADSPERATHRDVGALGKLLLSYTGEGTSANATLSRSLTPASGRTGATQLTGATLTFFERIAGGLSGRLDAGYARNRSAEKQYAAQAVDERSRSISGTLIYAFQEAQRGLTLEGGYSYHGTKYLISGAKMAQNIFMLRLNWQHEMFR